MAAAFSQSMRSLAADRHPWSLLGLILIFLLLGGWGVWFVAARAAVYALTPSARLEVDQAGHPIVTPITGRIMASHLVVGHEVQAGEVLIELNADAMHLQDDEARAQRTALIAQREARNEEIHAEETTREDERHAARVALAEANARYREGNIAAQAARERAAIFARLHSRGLAPQLEMLRTKAEADEKQAATDALHLSISRLESEQRTKDSDRTTRLAQFRREVTRLDGDIHTMEATLARLAYSIDQSHIRAPIAGYLAEGVALQPGTMVHQGDQLGVVLPTGTLRMVAFFSPATAMGRVRPGQPARLRLEGFPWAQYGSLAGVVSSVATEVRDGMIRVEVRLAPTPQTLIPLQHGLPGTVEIEVERVSPATLVLRSVGKHLSVKPRNAMAVGSHTGVP